MNELKIKLENLQCTLTDPVSDEDIRAAWHMVEEIIADVDQFQKKIQNYQNAADNLLLAIGAEERVEYAVWQDYMSWYKELDVALGGE